MNNKKVNIQKLIYKEFQRQNEELQLIPSENFTSIQVRNTLGSVLVHKYSEGQIGKRYYEGNYIIDKIEKLCKDRALNLFGLKSDWHVNVQPYSGSIANLAVYNSLLKPKDKIMGMYLYDGGHLSHGWKYKDKTVSLSSKIYKTAYYYVDSKTGVFNYDQVKKLVLKEKPKILISGGTAYPREINHKRMSLIAKEYNTYYMADIAHEAGLVASGVNKSPFAYADIVTMTTHKTLRGPKGAMIFCKKKFAKEIDKSVFPGIQGGPMNNNIAAIAVCLKEAQSKKFKQYSRQIIKNAKRLAKDLKKYNFNLISGGTDKHLILIDLRNKNISGKYAAKALSISGIILNKNTIPSEPQSPINPSGIRLGTPTVTTRGMKEKQMPKIAKYIKDVIDIASNFTQLEFKNFQEQLLKQKNIIETKEKVRQLCYKFPLPK